MFISACTNLILWIGLDSNGTRIFQKNKQVILDELAASSYRLSLWAEPHQMAHLVLEGSGNNTTAQSFRITDNEIVNVTEYSLG